MKKVQKNTQEDQVQNKKQIEFSVDKMTATFDFDQVGEITGRVYRGPFRVKSILDPEEFLAAGRERRMMLGQNAAFASEMEFNIATALSELKYRIVDSPPFWNNGKVPDPNILLAVLDMAFEVEISFRKQAKEVAENALEKMKEHVKKLQKESKKKKAKEQSEAEGEEGLEE